MEMSKERLTELMKRANDKDIEALVELITYLIQLDGEIKQGIADLKKTMAVKGRTKVSTPYIS